MIASQIMSSPVVCVGHDTTVAELMTLLNARGISGVPVVDEGNHLVGVVSITDLLTLSIGDAGEAEGDADFHTSPAMDGLSHLNALLEPNEEALERRVSELMSTHIIKADEDTPVADIAGTMLSRRIHRIIIVRGEEAVGIVSVGDILRALSQSNAEQGETPEPA